MKYASLALFVLTTACAAPTFDVMPRYGELNADGDIGAALSGSNVLKNDVDDVGIDDDDGYPGVRVDLDFGSPRLVFLGQQSTHDGDGTLSQDITIDGTTITAGTDVDTDFDLGIYSALLLFDLLPSKKLDLALGFGVTAIDLDFQTEEQVGLNSVETDETLPVPVLAVQVGGQLGKRLELSALVSGISIDYDDDDITYIDADAFLRFAVFRPEKRARGSLVLGYRYIDMDAEYDDDDDAIEADLTFDGPYIGFELHF